MSNEINSTEHATIPCCPPLDPDGVCDVLDFHYRQIYNTTVQANNQPVKVEVTLHTRLERCPGPLALGDLIYTTTLLPGERVRLFTTDRRTQFTFDSASNVSYRHQQTSEERFYMAGVNNYMSDLTVRDSSRANNVSGGSFSSQAGTSGFFETLFSGPSVDVSGSYNAFSSSDFLREVSQHARSSHYRSEMATRAANSVSVGEVQTRSHTEGESEDHFESSSRTFANPNRCHAVTFLFYQINKTQTVKFTLESIRRRVIDPAADTRVTNKALVDRGEVSVIPNALLATDKERLEIEKIGRDSVVSRNRVLESPAIDSPRLGVATMVQPALVLVEPLPEDIRQEALQQVDQQLIAANLLDPDGNVVSEAQQQFSFEIQSSLPTAGLLVKGCLDECNICEPALLEEIEQDIRRKRLENNLLKKQIDLLEKSQEYRCCPPDWVLVHGEREHLPQDKPETPGKGRGSSR